MAKRSGNGKSTVGFYLNRVGVDDSIDSSYVRIVGPCIGLGRDNEEEGRIDRGSGVGAAAALVVQRRPQQQRAGL